MVAIDLVGIPFGRLTVVRADGKRNGEAAWLCECQCGTTITVRSWHLRSGHTQSCGCLGRELRKANGNRFFARMQAQPHRRRQDLASKEPA
jgi:hypothetical protein